VGKNFISSETPLLPFPWRRFCYLR